MLRKRGRGNLLRRIEELEGRLTDESCLLPNSPEWLAFWLHQYRLSEIGKPFIRIPLEAARPVINAVLDDDASDDMEEPEDKFDQSCETQV